MARKTFEQESTPVLCHLLALAMANNAHLTAKAILAILETRLSEQTYGV